MLSAGATKGNIAATPGHFRFLIDPQRLIGFKRQRPLAIKVHMLTLLGVNGGSKHHH